MIFCPTTPEKMVAQQLKEAQLGVLEHQKAAEYHVAVAQMFTNRIKRLETYIEKKE